MRNDKDLSISLNLPINLSAVSVISLFAVFSVLCFSTSFLIGGPQWLVGTIINTLLFLTAIFLPTKYFLPLVIFPSLGVLARGIVFGQFTFFLLYFLPAIWISNLVLIVIFRKLLPYVRYMPSVFLSAGLKSLFLFFVASICLRFHIVPNIFLQTMGLFQFVTALGGGIISLIALKLFIKHDTRS